MSIAAAESPTPVSPLTTETRRLAELADFLDQGLERLARHLDSVLLPTDAEVKPNEVRPADYAAPVVLELRRTAAQFEQAIRRLNDLDERSAT